MSQQIIGAFINRLREEMTNHADACVRYPKKDAFDHGVSVGTWQGLEKALQLLESVLRDDEENEARQ